VEPEWAGKNKIQKGVWIFNRQTDYLFPHETYLQAEILKAVGQWNRNQLHCSRLKIPFATPYFYIPEFELTTYDML
jgi:hypothetical protein